MVILPNNYTKEGTVMKQNEDKGVIFEISSMEADNRKPLRFTNETNYSKARQNPHKTDNPKEE